MPNQAKEKNPSFSARRRWSLRLNLVLTLVATLAILVMINYLGNAYFQRFRLGSSKQNLSPQTIKILESITNKIDVVLFFDKGKEEELYEWSHQLLKEYSFRNPLVRLQTVDFTRVPSTANVYLAKYRLNSLENKNFIIFDNQGRTSVVFANQLADIDIASVLQGENTEFNRTSFRGEMLFTAALFNITYPRQEKAYFLSGHGEHNPAESSQQSGYGKFSAQLKEVANLSWDKITLLGTNDIPENCSLLIIAGPKASLLQSETAKIDAYLKRERGGRMLVMLNNGVSGKNDGLETLLKNWGIGVGDEGIVEEKELSLAEGDLLTSWLNPDHPVSKPIALEERRVRLLLPRAVFSTVIKSTEPPDVKILAATSENARQQFELRQKEPVSRKKGSLPLIVAMEQGSIKGVSVGARIIAIGDSHCFQNDIIDSNANRDFSVFSVNWLLDRPQAMLAGLAPRPIKRYKLILTQSELKSMSLLFLAGVPGMVLFLGLLVSFRRRH